MCVLFPFFLLLFQYWCYCFIVPLKCCFAAFCWCNLSLRSKIFRYIKIGKLSVSYHIWCSILYIRSVSSLISIACPCHIHSVSGHHLLWSQKVCVEYMFSFSLLLSIIYWKICIIYALFSLYLSSLFVFCFLIKLQFNSRTIKIKLEGQKTFSS